MTRPFVRTNLSSVKDDRSKLSQISTSANQQKKDGNETGEIEKSAHGEGGCRNEMGSGHLTVFQHV